MGIWTYSLNHFWRAWNYWKDFRPTTLLQSTLVSSLSGIYNSLGEDLNYIIVVQYVPATWDILIIKYTVKLKDALFDPSVYRS